MATETPRVWFKSISLENVRSFGTKQTIYFTEDGTENGKVTRWNVILGDNGTGKTTVLKGLVLSLFYFKSEVNYKQKDYAYYLRKPEKKALIDSVYVWNKDVNARHYISINWENGVFIRKDATDQGQLIQMFDILSKLSLHAYGANRNINEISTQEAGSKATTLFDENATLIGAASWLMEAEYIDLKTSHTLNRYELVKGILLKLFAEEVLDIEIKVSNSATPHVFFKTHYGDVRLHELSLGYKTLIAWMVDFAKGLLDRYPDSSDPLAEPAVCLVDEIDLHLHPKFQRTIIKFLTETFPNTQFIVTAHSPLIVVAAEERPLDANIILLKREGDETVVVNDPVDVSNWSVDQILNSDLFGYVPPRSESLMQLRTERDKLLAKPKLTKKDNTRLAELDEKIGFVPFGQDQVEVQAETIIQRLADVLRKQQQVQ